MLSKLRFQPWCLFPLFNSCWVYLGRQAGPLAEISVFSLPRSQQARLEKSHNNMELFSDTHVFPIKENALWFPEPMIPLVSTKGSGMGTRNMKKTRITLFHPISWTFHSYPQRPQSFWSASRIEISGRTRFFSMCKVLVLCFQPIRFTSFYNESMNRGLLVLKPARGLDPWCSLIMIEQLIPDALKNPFLCNL